MWTAPDAERISMTKHGIPIRNVWYMLLYAWDRLRDFGRWRAQVDEAPTLDALLASVLASLVEQRLRIGLGREYVSMHEGLRGIRGRIDFTRSLLDRSFERGEAWCTYTSFEVDAPRNQIVRSVLVRLVRRGDFGTDEGHGQRLRGRLRRVIRELEGVRSVEVGLGTVRRQQLGRNDGDYRLMLGICELLLSHRMPTESAGTQFSPELDRTELILYDLFERFVAAFYRYHLTAWSVRAQNHLQWPTIGQEHVPAMIPDLILEPRTEPSSMTVLDTKFTAKSLLTSRSGSTTFDSGHLYQLYAYLRTQEERSQAHATATGLLLYPQVGPGLSECMKVQGHDIRIETVDLAEPWGDIERDLLSLVEPAMPSSLAQMGTR